MKPDAKPRLIKLETPHYVMRTIEFADATEEWSNWFLDPVTARMLNRLPRRVSIQELQGRIAWFDRINRHLIGIFTKDTNHLVGIREVHIDWEKKNFTVNVLIGDPAARRHGARTETSDATYRYFFEELDLRSATITTFAHNADVVRITANNGWVKEKTEFRANATGGPPLELLHFRLWRGKWRERQKEREAASTPPGA